MISLNAWQKSSYSSGDSANCVEVSAWHKSTYSSSQANCIEVGVWRKSSYSSSDANCVEVATSALEVGVRDTKDRAGGTLRVPAPAWAALIARL